MALQYATGEEICAGDRVLFHGEPARIEFVVEARTGDLELDWYLEQGPGVMVREPKFFGKVYVPDPALVADLVFLRREDVPSF